MTQRFDVVICGGGLAGQTLARQLRREVPSARVAVVERQRRPLPLAAHKVGESSVELSSHYFGIRLGLGEYLHRNQLIKNGLRFFPGGGHTHPLHERTEVGPPQLAKVPSFQLDRGRLENDLRQMNEDDGVTLFEGVSVRQVDLDEADGLHRVTVSEGSGGAPFVLEARWVIDAAGRAALLRKKLGLNSPSGHLANSSWFRVPGKLDVSEMVPASETQWHARDPDKIRWLSTVHFMGEGYWLWFIPLASGFTSVGVVVHDSVHSFESIHTLDRTLEWIRRFEPRVHEYLAGKPIEDFLCLRHYSHGATRVYGKNRWACVGEAGPFADPFYSPGSDFIALGNSFVTELIRMDVAGEDFRGRVDEYDGFYLRFFDVACEVYRKSAPVLGSPRVLPSKVYWDDFNYWAFACQYFFKSIWKHGPEVHERFIEVAKKFAELQFKAQRLLSEWAIRSDKTPYAADIQLPPIPSLLANLHLDLEKDMSAEETLAYMLEKHALAEELLAELGLRSLIELGPTLGLELAAAVDLASFPRLAKDRVAVETTTGGARRRGLPLVARDLERCVGRVVPSAELGNVGELVERAWTRRAEAAE
jgi:flavin-dependent dehydrogenase